MGPPTYGTFFGFFSAPNLWDLWNFMKKGRNFENFSLCGLLETIICANFSILRPKLYVAKACSNIETGKKIIPRWIFFNFFAVFFFTFQKIQPIGHPTYGTFLSEITCTKRSHKLAHDCICLHENENGLHRWIICHFISRYF